MRQYMAWRKWLGSGRWLGRNGNKTPSRALKEPTFGMGASKGRTYTRATEVPADIGRSLQPTTELEIPSRGSICLFGGGTGRQQGEMLHDNGSCGFPMWLYSGV